MSFHGQVRQETADGIFVERVWFDAGAIDEAARPCDIGGFRPGAEMA